MHSVGERKCLHCEGFFTPDVRNRRRQRYCAKEPCRRASKAASQQRWLSRPENADYFQGADNVARVKAWRAAHPGYWKRAKPKRSLPLQDILIPQPAAGKAVAKRDEPAALQDIFTAQPPLLIGLIAHLADVTLQEDIAAMTGRLIAKGHAVMGVAPGPAFPRC